MIPTDIARMPIEINIEKEVGAYIGPNEQVKHSLR